MVLVALESDAACTILSGHSARKMQCWFEYDATKTQEIENKNCEDTDCPNPALSSDMTTLQEIVATARSVGWGGMKNCLLPVLFLRSVSSLSCCPVINIGICLKDMKLS
jgi:hypothetical protein